MGTNKNESIVQRFREIHGERYGYENVNYVNNKTPVEITCSIHGVFKQAPIKHLMGQGCPSCAGTKKGTKETFVQKANEIHNNKYDYSKVEYVNNRTKVVIICPIHGEFEQDPHNHLKGKGCPLCAKQKNIDEHPTRRSSESFIKDAIKVHGNYYDYSLVDYKQSRQYITIICPKHGPFKQLPSSHLVGCGCPDCGNTITAQKRTLTTSQFIEKAKSVHGDKYDYSLVNYTKAKDSVDIICHRKNANGIEHGLFRQSATHHLSGCGCPRCAHIESKGQNEIEGFIRQLLGNNVEILIDDRNILDGKELDIFIPSMNLAIEYHGMIWHSEYTGKNQNYHLDKLNTCRERGIKLIQILESEFLTRKEIVLDKLSYVFKKEKTTDKIFARDCQVKEIDKNTAEDFLESNHIQGFQNSTIYLGCFDKLDNIVAVMSFKKETEDSCELTRFATKIGCKTVGMGGKLFAYFLSNYPQYVTIKSFADRRWTFDETNNLYTKLGFTLDGITRPDYHYTRTPLDYIHKFNFRKKRLMKRYSNMGLTMDMTETEMTNKLGFYKIWDCGLYRYIYKRK